MKRLSIIIDNGLDEINFEVPSDKEGLYNILDIAQYYNEEEMRSILLNIANKIAEYENTKLQPKQVEKLKNKYKELQKENKKLKAEITEMLKYAWYKEGKSNVE